MIVEITSCAPETAFSRPAIAPHAAPPRQAATIASTTWGRAGIVANEEPTQTAK